MIILLPLIFRILISSNDSIKSRLIQSGLLYNRRYGGNMKKLAVVFQGIGYNSDKPLLYYSKKLAAKYGYDIVEVKFSNIDKSVLREKKNIPEEFGKAIKQTEDTLSGIVLSDYEDILFVSKSIGTVAAAAYEAKNDLKVKQVFFTPLEQTFEYVKEGNGLVFFGTADPFIEPARVKDLCIKTDMTYHIYEGANHSLETGDVAKDVRNLSEVMDRTEQWITDESFTKKY